MHPQKQHTSLQNRKITFFHTGIYRGPEYSLPHKAYQKQDQANLHVNFGSHKHRLNKQSTIQYVSSVYAEVPQFMGSLNTCITSTYYTAQWWEQVPPEFWFMVMVTERLEIFDFHMPRHGWFVRRTILHSHRKYIHSGARYGCNVQSGRFDVQLRLMHGPPNRGRNP